MNDYSRRYSTNWHNERSSFGFLKFASMQRNKMKP
jgi:hypothetical protein